MATVHLCNMSERTTTEVIADNAGGDEPDVRPEASKETPREMPTEIGGPKEADPTRYGDWTVKGRCIDF